MKKSAKAKQEPAKREPAKQEPVKQPPARQQPARQQPAGWPFGYWLAAIMALYLLIALRYFVRGGFVEDEGFYTLAARNVMHGMKPYRDFFFPQMPVLPYVYAVWISIFGASIESARVLSILFGSSSAALISVACYRRGGKIAGIVAALLLTFNLHYVADTLCVKTQAITVFLTSCSIFFLSGKDQDRPLRRAALGMLFMTLAFLARLSILPSILVLWVYLGWELRHSFRYYFILLAVNVVVIAAAFAYFDSGGNMIYGVYRFFKEYYPADKWSWARLGITIHSWLGNELPVIFLFFCGIWVYVTGALKVRKLSDVTSNQLFCGFLLLSYCGATALHWINIESYATHQTSIIAYAVAFSCVVLSSFFEELEKSNRGLWAFALAALLCLPLPLGELGVSLGFDVPAGQDAMSRVREALGIIGRYASAGDTILTFDDELVVDGNYRVPPGYDCSEFSYFPLMADDRARKLHLVTLRQLQVDIESEKGKVICVDDRHFAILSLGNPDVGKQLMDIINTHYRQAGSVQTYGQFGKPLYIFAARGQAAR